MTFMSGLIKSISSKAAKLVLRGFQKKRSDTSSDLKGIVELTITYY
jgi:hypothetical protein